MSDKTPVYPSHLVSEHVLADGTQLTIRPIRRDDAGIEVRFVESLSPESRYFRFMDALRELSPAMLSHFTDIDYQRHMALIGVVEQAGEPVQVGVARYLVDESEATACEFALAVADSWQRRGIGSRLLEALMTAARTAGLTRMHGDVLASNYKMLQLMTNLGFAVTYGSDAPQLVYVELALT
jgi:acetyltransferase